MHREDAVEMSKEVLVKAQQAEIKMIQGWEKSWAK